MKSAHVLLTGVTGFVGKVVLEELLRRRSELGIAGVTVLVRPSKNRQGEVIEPAARFMDTVAKAEVFRGLEAGWTRLVEVVACDLEKPQCGLSEVDHARVTRRTTHVIHCAASVEFDLPIQEAARANVTTALEVLELSRACRKLVGMVDVSTAYVNVWRNGPIVERLAHLPRSADDMLADIVHARRPEAEMLAETGHPNTYTFTKCITEHLISQRRADVPVIIVRPSIVSALWRCVAASSMRPIWSGISRCSRSALAKVLPWNSSVRGTNFTPGRSLKNFRLAWVVMSMRRACSMPMAA